MSINKGIDFKDRDVFVDYPFDEVMFRWDHAARAVYVKFYGGEESAEPVEVANRLFNDALLFGDEITAPEYERGLREKH